jgi:ABC-2 type transport system permease protein
VSTPRRTDPGGAATGYRGGRTLRVPVELRRQLHRRRTRVALGFLVVLPLLLLAAFTAGSGGSSSGSGQFVDLATSSGLNFTVFALFAASGFLLVVIVALFFGDTISSEASWSTLKYLLAAPVPRGRLLRQKALVAALTSAAGLVLLPAVSLVVGLLAYGTGSLVTPLGGSLPLPAGIARIAIATAYLAVSLLWVAGLGLLLTVLTDAPLGAVGGAVLVAILSEILDSISALGGLRAYLPTHYARAWSDLFATNVDWGGMARGALSALIYATVFAVLALYQFKRKDITS